MMDSYHIPGCLTIQLGVVVPVAEFVGRNFARNLDGFLGTRGLEDLHKQIDEDAESGASQVAHALGKRHDKEQLQLRWPRVGTQSRLRKVAGALNLEFHSRR